MFATDDGHRRRRLDPWPPVRRGVDRRAPQFSQEGRKIHRIEQGLLAEFDGRELAALDRGVERCSPDAEQLECFANAVGDLREAECARIDRLASIAPGRSCLSAPWIVLC